MDVNDLSLADIYSIGSYRFDALLKLLLNKNLITKDEFNKMLDERCVKRQQIENVDIEKIKELTELAKI